VSKNYQIEEVCLLPLIASGTCDLCVPNETSIKSRIFINPLIIIAVCSRGFGGQSVVGNIEAFLDRAKPGRAAAPFNFRFFKDLRLLLANRVSGLPILFLI
jgi:hypothetical protein